MALCFKGLVEFERDEAGEETHTPLKIAVSFTRGMVETIEQAERHLLAAIHYKEPDGTIRKAVKVTELVGPIPISEAPVIMSAGTYMKDQLAGNAPPSPIIIP